MKTTREAAEVLDITEDAVRKYCQSGRIVASKNGRGDWKITEQSIRKYEETRRIYERKKESAK